MIIYEYRCNECDNAWEEPREMEDRNRFTDCPACGSSSVCRDFSGGARIEVFEPMVYDHITYHPIRVESKRQLREECKKHGVKACRLM